MKNNSVDSFLLLDAREGVEPLLSFTQCTDSQSALEALITGLEINELWRAFGDVRLVARATPTPLMAAFGHFTPRQRMLLENLSAELNDVILEHRHVGYAEAEEVAVTLAETLTWRFGREGLDSFRFTAIPRGGWIVLGMLSYCLGLRPDQLGIPGDSLDVGEFQTWVVVDDCALSGVRFREFLTSHNLDSVVFCPLYAPAGLCEAIQRAESGVEACLNAVDLRDVAPQRFGEAYPQWLEQRRQRAGKSAYWLGIAEYVAFAWCEPQSKFWDDEAGCYRASWNLLPPSLSLKRRKEAEDLLTLASFEPPRQVVLQATTGAAIEVAPRALWCEFDSAMAVAKFPSDPSATAPCFRLNDIAGDMWRALLQNDSMESALSWLHERYSVPDTELRRDLLTFVAELERQGLLQDS